MNNVPLGDKIKDLRNKLGISMRELARRTGISAPFMSDIELGRRYPSDEVFALLAKQLKIPVEELQQHDARESLSDLKRMMHNDPSWGFAFRKIAEHGKQGKLTPSEIIKRLTENKGRT